MHTTAQTPRRLRPTIHEWLSAQRHSSTTNGHPPPTEHEPSANGHHPERLSPAQLAKLRREGAGIASASDPAPWNTPAMRESLGFDPEALGVDETVAHSALRDLRSKQRPTPWTQKPRAKTKQPKQKRIYLSQAERHWLTLQRQEGEAGMLTITQNVAEALTALPSRDMSFYVYMRALAFDRNHPGSCWPSHRMLAEKFQCSDATAERITMNLRKRWDLIALKRRGAAIHGTANWYVILPLTEKRLARLRAHRPSPMRASALTHEGA